MVLRLVAEGRLTPEEAAPIIEALSRAERTEDEAVTPLSARLGRVQRRVERAFERAERARERAEERAHRGGGRHLRIRVTERGRQVVNLRIPVGFAETALQFVPGLAGDQSQRIRDAVRGGVTGPIVDVEEEDGSGVLISVE